MSRMPSSSSTSPVEQLLSAGAYTPRPPLPHRRHRRTRWKSSESYRFGDAGATEGSPLKLLEGQHGRLRADEFRARRLERSGVLFLIELRSLYLD